MLSALTWVRAVLKKKIVCKYLFFILFTLLMIAILSPFFSNGYWFDDSLNSQVYSVLKRFNGNLWEHSFRVFLHWAGKEGRLMAGFLYGYPLFYIARNLFVAKLLNATLVLAGVFVFGYAMRLLGFVGRSVWLWALLVAGSFQVHGAGLDPLAGFMFHYPLLLLELGGCLLLLARWVKTDRTVFLVAAMVLWLFVMFVYEINVVFVPMALGCVVLSSRTVIKSSLFVLGCFAIYLGMNVYLRSHAWQPTYTGVQFSLGSEVLAAYLKQLSASVPFSSYLFWTHGVLSPVELLRNASTSPLAWTVFAGAALVAWRCLEKPGRFPLRVWVVPLCMLFLPPFFVAISARYQNEINFGVGTLPVYYQFFGCSFVLVNILAVISVSLFGRFLSSLLVATVLAFNVTMNFEMVQSIDNVWRTPRDLLSAAAKGGLLDEIRDGDLVHVKGAPHYVNGNLLFELTKKRIFVPTEDTQWFGASKSPEGREFELRYDNGRYVLNRTRP